MVQPGDPNQGQGYGGQQPWGQPPGGQQPWGQPAPPPQGPPQQPAWGQPPADPWQTPQPSGPPATGWSGQYGGAAPYQGYGQPPPPGPPRKSNTGLVLGLIGGAVVLLLVGAIIAVVAFSREERKNPVANPSAATSESPSPSPSPSATGIDPDSLDSKNTDETELSTSAIFPTTSFTGGNRKEYRRAGTLETNACNGVGAENVRRLLGRYDCDRMVVGVYLNSDEDLFSAILVIPLGTDEDAEALRSDILVDKQEIINKLTYYCPSDGHPGAKLCKRSRDNLPTWYASFHTFHRYLFVMISLYTDGHRTKDVSEINEMTAEVRDYVEDTMLGASSSSSPS